MLPHSTCSGKCTLNKFILTSQILYHLCVFANTYTFFIASTFYMHICFISCTTVYTHSHNFTIYVCMHYIYKHTLIYFIYFTLSRYACSTIENIFFKTSIKIMITVITTPYHGHSYSVTLADFNTSPFQNSLVNIGY